MLDFENSGILIAPLLPWNIAAYVPIVMIGTSTDWLCAIRLLPIPRTTSFTGYDYGIKINQS